MAKKITTVFQDMSKVFNGGWDSAGMISQHTNSYDMTDMNPTIFKTTDKDEYASKKLELQQEKYLQNRWVKAGQSLAISSYNGLSNVRLMYRDVEQMDNFPEIGAALTIVSEESTITSEKGMVVNVFSKSERIKSILEDLFVNRLNLQITSQMIIRAMAKYGNQFMLLDIDKKAGVRGWKQLPVAEVERVEAGLLNPYLATSTANNDMATKFIWTNTLDSNITPFRNWQIAHFRLLDNSMFLPYGVSYLQPARRHWRLLSLMEDMMLIYRLERSMERRVYKIFVGSLDDADIPAFIDKIANNFKRTPIVDPQTGQLDLRKNILPVWKNTPIPLQDGRVITIQELSKEFDEGKINYVYSIQKNTGKVVKGKVVWCGKTGHPKNMIKITYSNKSYMMLAKEHEVMLESGEMKRADELVHGDYIMPFIGDSKDNSYSDESEQFVVDTVTLVKGDDVYCMTVEGESLEEKDDRHNFALYTYVDNDKVYKNGCFVSNCASDDIFIPVRTENAPTPIDTLTGAKNLDAIDDIKFIQNKVLTALRIPKSFLNFDESAGDGKNLALMDIRFARTVNRIQQAFLMELTKVATIHLYLLGFEDDLTNFNLSMNNPSTQAEQLELENLAKKINIVRDAVSDPGDGLQVLSMVRAWRQIMKMSDKDIKENLEEIRLERGLSAELEKTGQIIKRSGLFDIVDRIYGEPGAQYQDDGSQGDGPGGFGGGGGSFGGGLDSLGSPGSDNGPEIGGQESQEPTNIMGGGMNGETPMANTGNNAPSEAPGTPPQEPAQTKPMESYNKSNKPLINESKTIKSQNKKVNKIFEMITSHIDQTSIEPKKTTIARSKVYDNALNINEEMSNIFEQIDINIKDTEK